MQSISNAPPPGLKISPYNQVINAVTNRFPNLTRQQIDTALIGIRRANGDFRDFSISSMIDTLITHFDQRRSQHGASHSASSSSQKGDQPAAPNRLNTSIEIGNCSICVSPMYSELDKVETLDCGHQYHTVCIRKWLGENKSCPQCRSYSLLQEEYPSLN